MEPTTWFTPIVNQEYGVKPSDNDQEDSQRENHPGVLESSQIKNCQRSRVSQIITSELQERSNNTKIESPRAKRRRGE